MTARFQFRRANASSWTSSDPTLAAGELGYELDTGKFKIGDGSTVWTALDYSTSSVVDNFPSVDLDTLAAKTVDTPTDAVVNDFAYGNGVIVKVHDYNGGLYYSLDNAESWNFVNINNFFWPNIVALSRVIYAKNQFIAIGDFGAIVTSYDGINWTPRAFQDDVNNNFTGADGGYELTDIAYGNGKFVAISRARNVQPLVASPVLLVSNDAHSWSQITPLNFAIKEFSSIIYGDDYFVVTGSFIDNNTLKGFIAYSASNNVSTSWSHVVTTDVYAYNLGFYNHRFIAGGISLVDDSTKPPIIYADSSDLTSWTRATSVTAMDLSSFAFGGGTTRNNDSGLTGYYPSLVYSNDRWFACSWNVPTEGDASLIYSDDNGSSWQGINAVTNNLLYGSAYTVVGSSITIAVDKIFLVASSLNVFWAYLNDLNTWYIITQTPGIAIGGGGYPLVNRIWFINGRLIFHGWTTYPWTNNQPFVADEVNKIFLGYDPLSPSGIDWVDISSPSVASFNLNGSFILDSVQTYDTSLLSGGGDLTEIGIYPDTSVLQLTGTPTANGTISGFADWATWNAPSDGRLLLLLNTTNSNINISSGGLPFAYWPISTPSVNNATLVTTLPSTAGMWFRFSQSLGVWNIIDSFAVTPSTGTGKLVRDTSSTITSPIIVGQSFGSAQSFGTTGTSNEVSINSDATIFRYTGAGTATITGFGVSGNVASAGRMIVVMNTTANDLTLAHQSSSSFAQYRLNLGSGDLVLGANKAINLVYDGNSSRWRALGGTASGSTGFTYSTTATAGGTTTLTSSSNQVQYFTGSANQTITLPVASTMTLGQAFYIHNLSTGTLTVQSSGSNTVITLEAGKRAEVRCILTSGTTAASWDAAFDGATTGTGTGALTFGTSPTISLPTIDNPKLGYTTTATAAGTTALTSASNYRQYFTGTTTQTVTLPSTSTLVLGQAYEVHNLSTGTVTIQSFGTNTVATLEGGKSGLFTCVSTSVNTAAAWDATFDGATTNTGTGALVFGTSPTISTPTIDNPKLGYTTTATAAGSTTLTASSNFRQYFTGSTTQTVVLPVASTMTLGQGFEIHNLSTGSLTINSSGGNLVMTLEGGKSGLITCILTSGTTAASWDKTFDGATTSTGTGALVFGTSPTLTTPALGTPSSLTLTNATGTPTSITLTNGTGLPIAGINGLGGGVGTWLATPSSANLATAITDETGSGALVFGTSPSINGQAIGTVQTYSTTGTSNNISVTAGVSILRYTGAGIATLTGFSAAAATPASGRILVIINSTSNALTLSHENASSTAAYRLNLPGATNKILGTNETVILVYDFTASRWMASTGTLTLTDSVSSTSTTTAATPNSVKSAYDLANAAIPKAIVDVKGDIIVATANDTVTRLAAGTDGYVLMTDSNQTSGVKWAAAPGSGTGIAETIIDAKGDLIVGAADNSAARLQVGTDTYVLTADSTATNGVKWAAPTGGGSTSLATSIKWGND